jgi:hypothetical protein
VSANNKPLLFFIRRLKINHKSPGSYVLILEDDNIANTSSLALTPIKKKVLKQVSND